MDDLELLPIAVKEGENGDLILEWDETDPRAIEMGINDWTSEDWAKCIEESLDRIDKQSPFEP